MQSTLNKTKLFRGRNATCLLREHWGQGQKVKLEKPIRWFRLTLAAPVFLLSERGNVGSRKWFKSLWCCKKICATVVRKLKDLLL